MISRIYYPPLMMFALAILFILISLFCGSQYEIIRGPSLAEFELTSSKPAYYHDLGKLQEGQYVHVFLDFWPSENQSTISIYEPGILSHDDYLDLEKMGKLNDYPAVTFLAFFGYGELDSYSADIHVLARDNYFLYIFGPSGVHNSEISVIKYPYRDFTETLFWIGFGGVFFTSITMFIQAYFDKKDRSS